MGKKVKMFISYAVERDELRSIKVLASLLNLVPFIVVRKTIKKFLNEYENAESFPQEFLLYCKMKKLKYAFMEKEINDVK